MRAGPRARAPAVPLLGAPPPAPARAFFLDSWRKYLHAVPAALPSAPERPAARAYTGSRHAAVQARLGLHPAGRPAAAPSSASRDWIAAGRPHATLLRGHRDPARRSRSPTSSRGCSGPTLVISPNKTLAAQLYGEFKAFFPENAVEYFVSYYDYYQPEAYIPQSDTYIEKDALINDEIDRMRHSTTTSLFERRDVVIVASVSCIYGIGSPETYHGHAPRAGGGRGASSGTTSCGSWSRSSTSATTTTSTGGRSASGATWSRCSRPPPRASALRVELFGDTIERHPPHRPAEGAGRSSGSTAARVYPASHYVTPAEQLERAMESIKDGAAASGWRSSAPATACWRRSGSSSARCSTWRCCGRSATATGSRTTRATSPGREPGETPADADRLPARRTPWWSSTRRHVDRARSSGACTTATARARRRSSSTASACPRPSTTGRSPSTSSRAAVRPGALRLGHARRPATSCEKRRDGGRWPSRSSGRPGSRTPKITVRPAGEQVDDLMEEIRARAERDERVLVTTLTKRMAEDLTEYYQQIGPPRALPALRHRHPRARRGDPRPPPRQVRRPRSASTCCARGSTSPRCRWWRSSTPTRRATSARRPRSIQTSGRAARNVSGEVIMYADKVTGLDADALGETERRRVTPGRVQRRARHHPGVDPDVDPRVLRVGLGARLLHGRGGGAGRRGLRVAGGAGRGASSGWRRR